MWCDPVVHVVDTRLEPIAVQPHLEVFVVMDGAHTVFLSAVVDGCSAHRDTSTCAALCLSKPRLHPQQRMWDTRSLVTRHP